MKYLIFNSDSIRFSIFTAKDIAKYSTIQVVNRDLYKRDFLIPFPYGPLDTRLVSVKKIEGGC